MLCKDCPRGKTERIPGNGISEPPYIQVVRCPFDNKFYHNPGADCNSQEQLKALASMLDFVNVQGRWFDEDTYVMEWDGGKDEEGDEFIYQVEWQVDHGVLIFSKVFDNDTCYLRITEKEKATIIKRMMELVLAEGGKRHAD
jgi:hypothetical protein